MIKNVTKFTSVMFKSSGVERRSLLLSMNSIIFSPSFTLQEIRKIPFYPSTQQRNDSTVFNPFIWISLAFSSAKILGTVNPFSVVEGRKYGSTPKTFGIDEAEILITSRVVADWKRMSFDR